MRERERQRERERVRERERERARKRERERGRESERARERESERGIERERERARARDRDRNTHNRKSGAPHSNVHSTRRRREPPHSSPSPKSIVQCPSPADDQRPCQTPRRYLRDEAARCATSVNERRRRRRTGGAVPRSCVCVSGVACGVDRCRAACATHHRNHAARRRCASRTRGARRSRWRLSADDADRRGGPRRRARRRAGAGRATREEGRVR